VLSCRYQRYLESVLEVADEYQEVQDLLLRHATLQATNDDLRAHQQRCSKEAEDIRTALQAYVKQQTDDILDLNNTLAKLKKQLEQQEEQAGVLVSRQG
jgi:flagellar motility protein MotE (MotC chaperone)